MREIICELSQASLLGVGVFIHKLIKEIRLSTLRISPVDAVLPSFPSWLTPSRRLAGDRVGSDGVTASKNVSEPPPFVTVLGSDRAIYGL